MFSRMWMLALLTVLSALTQSLGSKTPQHWKETATETIWTERYTNCDYGYFVGLPKGVVAHGSKSPAPNHGFLVALPDISRELEATTDEERFLWISAEHNAYDTNSLSELARKHASYVLKKGQRPRVISNRAATLEGVRAIFFVVHYSARGKDVVEEEVIALTRGIIYEIGLRTDREHQSEDEANLKSIRTGFHLLPLPVGECKNY